MVELENNKVTTIQTKTEIASFNQKLEGVDEDIKGKVRKSIGSVLRKYTGATKQDETKGEAKLLSKPYLCETRVEYKSASPMDSPPGFDWGKDDRKLGL